MRKTEARVQMQASQGQSELDSEGYARVAFAFLATTLTVAAKWPNLTAVYWTFLTLGAIETISFVLLAHFRGMLPRRVVKTLTQVRLRNVSWFLAIFLFGSALATASRRAEFVFIGVAFMLSGYVILLAGIRQDAKRLFVGQRENNTGLVTGNHSA